MSYVLSFLLMFFPLVIFHELGHFLVAKFFGIRVTRFAFGFGRELFRFHYKGTDYRWNLIPLGGYVDLMGEVSITGRIPDDPNHFYNRPKWIRFLVMVMGPLFNLILAFLIFWLIYAQPRRELKFLEHPLTVGYVSETSSEFEAGLRPGDQILEVNGANIETYDEIFRELVLLPGKNVNMDVIRDGEALTISYVVQTTEKDAVGEIEFTPGVIMKVGEVAKDSPAMRAGLLEGDSIIEANGAKVFYSWKNNMLSDVINKSAGAPVLLTVMRNGELLKKELLPEPNDEGKFIIGIQIQFDFVSSNPGWQEAAVLGWQEFLNSSTLIYRAIFKLTKGDLSVKTLSGPIELGKVAKEQLERGWVSFLGLMAILSLNLGIFNLIPIPILDGGEIFVLLIEGVTRRDFSLQSKINIKIVGFLLLLCLMATVLVSDALKVFF